MKDSRVVNDPRAANNFSAANPAAPGLQNRSSVPSPYTGAQRPRAVLASPAATAKEKQPPSSLTSLYSAASAPSRQTAPEGPKTPPRSSGTRPAYPAFGDIPPTEKLRPLGHSKIDLSVRWVTKQPDGLHLQSRYGTLRLSPVGSAIIRVTFARNTQPDPKVHPGIAVDRLEKFWMYRDSGNTLELTTDELSLQVDKSTGAIRYLYLDEDSGQKQLLLQERKRECRQLETASRSENSPKACGMQSWLFLDYGKEEHLYAFSPESAGIPLKGSARYISRNEGEGLPMLISDRGYGILMAASSPVFCCDIPAYGSYLHAENEKQLDFYFIAGRKKDTLLNAYAYLCGKI